MTWLTILGTAASIGGAILAWIQAHRSSNFADKAKRIQEDFIERRKVVEVSEVYSATERILGVVSKVGSTSTETSLKTICVRDIAREVEEYTRLLNVQNAHFNEDFINHAKPLCENLREDIEALVDAQDYQSIKNVGKRIYFKIEDFLPKAKQLLDSKKEKAKTL